MTLHWVARESLQLSKRKLSASTTVAVHAGTRKNRKAKLLQILAQLRDGFKENPLNSCGTSGLDIFFAVIDEDRFSRGNFQQ